jgi:pimeloyl-ACP methyl ester carboxylesterase
VSGNDRRPRTALVRSSGEQDGGEGCERSACPWSVGGRIELGPGHNRTQAEGASVSAAPLPLTSLADDVAALNRSLDRTEGPIVLAGHAYAGAVIALARPERVKALVYVTALAPDEGEKVADVFYRLEPHPQAPKLAPDSNGLIWLPEEAFAAAFA